MTVKFTNGNRKINELAKAKGLKKNQVYAFDLPAGWSCPMASICQSRADKITGKISDGKDCLFRCYAASSEAAFSSVRALRWNNFDALRHATLDDMVELILSGLPKFTKIVRIHSSGDFFSKNYFMAWVRVAELRPDITFFGYTKVLQYVQYDKPSNFMLQYSFGGKMDAIHKSEPVAYVVKSVDDAKNLGIRIACVDDPSDDFDFIMRGESFALLLHGTQPAKAKAQDSPGNLDINSPNCRGPSKIPKIAP